MPDPAIDWRGEALYFLAADSARWRVHDAHFTCGRPHRVPLGDARANTRYFVNGTGERRAYTFADQASRALSVQVLAEHFMNREYVGARLDPKDR